MYASGCGRLNGRVCGQFGDGMVAAVEGEGVSGDSALQGDLVCTSESFFLVRKYEVTLTDQQK